MLLTQQRFEWIVGYTRNAALEEAIDKQQKASSAVDEVKFACKKQKDAEEEVSKTQDLQSKAKKAQVKTENTSC